MIRRLKNPIVAMAFGGVRVFPKPIYIPNTAIVIVKGTKMVNAYFDLIIIVKNQCI